MPSTTPDLSTVTCGAASRGAPLASAGGVRPRLGGGASPGRPRSGFGQASSNVAGGGSAISGAGGGDADGGGRRSGESRSGAKGSLVRDAARSRSFRELDENIRLRFGFGGAGSAGGGAGDISDAAPSAGHGGGSAPPEISPGC